MTHPESGRMLKNRVFRRFARSGFLCGVSVLSILAAFAFPTASWGQGLRMSPDFLPLETGNTWTYAVEDEAGRTTRFTMEILDHRIVDGLSLYVFSRLPFAPDATMDDPVGVRFDTQTRQYVFTNGTDGGPLFPATGERAEVVETDDLGLPLVVELDYGDRTLTIERNVGITAGSLPYAGGRAKVTLISGHVGEAVVGDAADVTDAVPPRGPGLPELDVESPVNNVVLPTETAPLITLEVAPDGNGHRFTLHVQNPTDRLMPFDFTTSQDFDFVVTEPGTEREVWRWARRMFFSQVLRSEALRARGEWVFEAEWNHTDNELNAVPAGVYQVRGILAAEEPLESETVEFRVD